MISQLVLHGERLVTDLTLVRLALKVERIYMICPGLTSLKRPLAKAALIRRRLSPV